MTCLPNAKVSSDPFRAVIFTSKQLHLEQQHAKQMCDPCEKIREKLTSVALL